MGARLGLLDAADCVSLDEAIRSLLFDTGVDVRSGAARDALARFGAMVDVDAHRVRFSDSVIKEALRLAPKEVLLASRDRAHDVRIPDGRPHVTTDGAGVNVIDLDTGRRRPSTTRDLVELTRVADALEAVDVQWPMVVAGDAPGGSHDLVEVASVLEHTSKHVQHEALSAAEANGVVRMAAAVVGGADELRRRPILSSVQCPVSPLVLEEGSSEGLMVLARAGVPVVPTSMVLLGGSSPVDPASGLVVSAAENLASLCLAQAAVPGAPVVWSICSGPIDMRSGSFAAAAPEAGLLNVAAVDLARHYGLPCLVAGFVSDSCDVGFQAGAEKLASGLLSLLAGADLVSGLGGLETDGTMSLEQLVLDADLVGYARRILEPFSVEAQAIRLDLLKRAGPGGNFLKERDTLLNFRRALWSPRILLRDALPADSTAEARLRERARSRARELRDTHEPVLLDEEVVREIRAIATAPLGSS